MGFPLLIANLLLAAGADALPPQCQVETLPAAKAACIALSAETVLHRIDLAVVEISTGFQGTQARNLARFQAELNRLQRDWRAEMESQCEAANPNSDIARQSCRYLASRARQRRVGRAIAEARAQLPGANPWAAPGSIEVFIPLPRHQRLGPYALPYLCLDIPLSGTAATDSWLQCGSDR